MTASKTNLAAVIFDMDGVLIDSEPVFHEVETEMFRELGIDVNRELHQSFLGTTFDTMWGSLIQRFGLDRSATELARLQQDRYLARVQSKGGVRPILGAINLVHELKATTKLALASSSTRRIVDAVLAQLAIGSAFGATIAGDEVGHGKPDPEPFLKSAERLSVDAGSCVVIEDSRNGLLAARAAGMRCVGYRNPNSGEQDLSAADMTVDGMGELDYVRLKALG